MLLIEKKLKQFSKKFANYTAIETCDFIITYKRLYQYVSYLTKVLSSSKEKNIIIYGEKKSLCIIAILACLFSGITYIPVSKSIPLNRLKKNPIFQYFQEKIQNKFYLVKIASKKNCIFPFVNSYIL